MGFALVSSMEKIEKTLHYTKLFSIYKSQLSSTQQEIINDYYFLDLSLSEIAENRGISRAGVDDALSKGTKRLDELENEMHLLDKQEKIKSQLETMKAKALNQGEINEIEDIEKELDYGIWSINR